MMVMMSLSTLPLSHLPTQSIQAIERINRFHTWEPGQDGDRVSHTCISVP